MLIPTAEEDEALRLATLRDYEILDTAPERTFDDIVRIAAQICDVPIALVSLVDERRQWFKAKHGIEAVETPNAGSLCSLSIRQDEPLIVEDTAADPRFANHPLVVNAPFITFYAGSPLIAPNGERIGTLCVIDQKPGSLSPPQIESLQSLANLVMDGFERRRAANKLAEALRRVQSLETLLSMCSSCKSIRGDGGDWVPVDQYLHRRSGTRVSHGFCPSCAQSWTKPDR